MPLAQQYLATIHENSFYHIICRAIDGKKLFYDDDNRIYFLSRYQTLLGDFADTYAYTLLDNHAHWVIKSKQGNEIAVSLKEMPPTNLHPPIKNF